MKPSALEVLGAFIQDAALGDQSHARTARLRLHIADTVGMIYPRDFWLKNG